MKKFQFERDIISLIALLLTIIALLSAIFSRDIFEDYFLILIAILFLVLFLFIINYFKKGIEKHEKEINKINEKINIHKDISEIKAKVNFLMGNFKIQKKGQADLIEVMIRLIQIGAIIFAGYIILRALGVTF